MPLRVNYIFKSIICLLFLVSGINSSAQEIKKTQDLGLWTGLSAKYKFSDDYTLSLSQDLRLFESLTELDKYITDIGINYRIDQNFKLGGNIRYILNRKKDRTLSNDFRYNLDFKFQTKIRKKLKLKYRLRYQSNYEDFFVEIKRGEKSNLRNKIALNYKLHKRHTLYTSSEIFREIVSFRKPYFNKIRFLIGDELKTRLGKLDFSIGYERELNSSRPLNYYFGRIYYTFEFKNEK